MMVPSLLFLLER